jgi:hypothetical protein
MVRIHIDDTELVRLELDLRAAPKRVQFGATKQVMAAAKTIDRQMTIDATGHQGNWFGIPGTEFNTPLELHVSHEMLDRYTAEIGIEMKGAGKLAPIIVYGSVNNAPVYDHMAGPRRVLPKIVEDFADMAEDSVLGERG